MIRTQTGLDRATKAGKVANVGESDIWLNAREGSTVYAREGSTVYAWEGSREIEQSSFNRQVAEWIVANPDSFDMSQWTCSTSMCWAGAAVHLAGERGARLEATKGYAGAAGYLCGIGMVKHFYRTTETDAMRSFAEAIASGKTIEEASA